MQVYHGHKGNDFLLKKHKNSRYGFPCLFFTNNSMLAKNYSDKKIINIDLDFEYKVDFKNEISHSPKFRNLIYDLRNKAFKSVLIENVYDRPDDSFCLEKSNIIVVFDLEILTNKIP